LLLFTNFYTLKQLASTQIPLSGLSVTDTQARQTRFSAENELQLAGMGKHPFFESFNATE
jgi:hypothetical protein